MSSNTPDSPTKPGKKTKKSVAGPSVAFVEDPFQIQTAEIREAQDSQDAIDEGLSEEDLAAVDATEITDEAPADAPLEAKTPEEKASDEASTEQSLQRLAESIAVQAAEDEALQEALVAAAGADLDPARELAAQIAEDQALSAELARENAEAEAAEAVDPELLAALPQKRLTDSGDLVLDIAEMESCIEALLFISEKPMSLTRLQEHLGPTIDKEIFKQALVGLQTRYQANHHGIEIVEVAGGFQFRTRPGRAALARKLAKVQTQRLSSGAMETLAIVAYRQPCMKEDVDQVRGVDSSYFVRGLLDRKLIRISGRSELPGRPMLYSTTEEFLQIFGLASLDAMPPLQELESMVPASQAKGEEDPRVKQMRKLVGEMNADTSTTLNYDPKEDEIILAEIRERVQSIPTSTASLDEQKAAEKAAKDLAKELSKNGGRASEPAETLFDAAAAEAPVADEAPANDALAADGESAPEAAADVAAPEAPPAVLELNESGELVHRG